jgi:hypothetical protein
MYLTSKLEAPIHNLKGLHSKDVINECLSLIHVKEKVEVKFLHVETDEMLFNFQALFGTSACVGVHFPAASMPHFARGAKCMKSERACLVYDKLNVIMPDNSSTGMNTDLVGEEHPSVPKMITSSRGIDFIYEPRFHRLKIKVRFKPLMVQEAINFLQHHGIFGLRSEVSAASVDSNLDESVLIGLSFEHEGKVYEVARISEGMAFSMTSDGTELTLPVRECYKYCKAWLSDGENTDDSDAEGK